MIPLLAIIFSAATAFADAVDDFYDGAFRQGVSAFEAGANDTALARLRVAAFGYLDDPPRYQTAQAYIAVAARRAGRMEESKNALRRILAAERVSPQFTKLQLSKALRTAIEEAAKALLPPQQAAQLTMPPAEQQLAAPAPTPPPTH